MGSQGSKAAKEVIAEKSTDGVGDPSPTKPNGQENGHVKTNGDLSPKADGDAAPVNGNGSAEPVKENKVESGAGDAIELAPAVEGEGAKADVETTKETKKKKKMISFKKPAFFKKRISFRKAKKETGEKVEETAVAASGEDQAEAKENPGATEAKTEENPGTTTSKTKDQSNEKEEESSVAGKETKPSTEEEKAEEAPAKEEKPAENQDDQSKPDATEASTKAAETEVSSSTADSIERKEE
ncbi:MARCKS-related protein 1-B [Latimeria chalumnae]|uniref:MARCKS like 1 n=1 Tax=Latimeria chalumnae TaxID=7897 RepID=H3BB37_LATCH|nr:PREDICTED: MARCKS-related protein [Latimeria chalumnae]|eukprot:XP_005995649.1 PREDICTED: MARCKS-related protein [Latimeria chalumnae]